jgi:protein TonB
MLGDAASIRARKMWVAGGVVLLHALFLCLALLARSRSAKDELVTESFVTMQVNLLQQRQDALRAEPRQDVRPQLQKLAPQLQAIRVEQFDIEVPETEPRDSPVLADISPPAASVPDQADTGLAGNAPDMSGSSGMGDGLVLIRRAMPGYPAAAARRGEQGITTVLMHVTPAGRVDSVKVERSSGSRQLDRAAVEAFQAWRFQRLPEGSPAGGRWLRTAQRFVLFAITYSRLDVGAAESVYEEHLKPKPGKLDDVTPGSEAALIRFMSQVRSGTIDTAEQKTRATLAELSKTLEKWGAVKEVSFNGIVGSNRWVTQWSKPEADGTRRAVEVNWSMFEVRHEHAMSEWLIAVDRAGSIWAARAAEAHE